MIVGICPHGVVVAGINEEFAAEEDLRQLALSYTLEKREEATMGGGCEPCAAKYEANCKVAGIEP